ncbi:MAG: SPOR domain-containing protein [Bacteroidia bacterium]
MKEIDYALYLAHFLRELPRVSVPGIGSFVRVPQKSIIDPRTGEMTPPFYTIKHQPGTKYIHFTSKFIQDVYGFSAEEADAFLKEMGRYIANYLKMPVELELPRVGKLRRIGGTYKLELFDDPYSHWSVDLEVAHLRSKTTTKVPLSVPQKSSKAPQKSKSTSPKVGSEQLVENVLSDAPKKRKLFIPILVGVVVALGIVGALVYFLGKSKPAPQIVEVDLSKRAPKPADTAAKVSSSPTREPESSSKPPSPQALRERGRFTPQEPKPETPKRTSETYKYHIIGAAAPSQAEAQAKAQEFEKKGLRTQLLPHPTKPGWYRISIYQSNSPKAAKEKLKQLKAEYPDAWLYK